MLILTKTAHTKKKTIRFFQRTVHLKKTKNRQSVRRKKCADSTTNGITTLHAFRLEHSRVTLPRLNVTWAARGRTYQVHVAVYDLSGIVNSICHVK